MNYNRIILAGRMCKAPEIRQTQGGAVICSFTLAENEQVVKKDGSKQEQVLFVDCMAAGKLGETIKNYFDKGSEIFIEGKLRISTWQDKAGVARQKHFVGVEKFSFVGAKPQQQTQPRGSFDMENEPPF